MVLDPARKPSAAFPAELLGIGEDSPRAPPWVPAAAAPRRETLAPLAEHPDSDRRVSWSPGAADVESEQEDDVAWSDDAASDDDDVDDDVTRCVEIKSFTARSSRRPQRHRRDTCSMAWRCRFLAARPSHDGRVIAEK